MSARCPICRKTVATTGAAESDSFPFCSKRCKMVDLGRWLNEDYKVSRPLAEDDVPDGYPVGPDSEPE